MSENVFKRRSVMDKENRNIRKLSLDEADTVIGGIQSPFIGITAHAVCPECGVEREFRVFSGSRGICSVCKTIKWM